MFSAALIDGFFSRARTSGIRQTRLNALQLRSASPRRRHKTREVEDRFRADARHAVVACLALWALGHTRTLFSEDSSGTRTS